MTRWSGRATPPPCASGVLARRPFELDTVRRVMPSAATWIDDLLLTRAPLRAGVLRYVEDEAYAESFGEEWSWFPTTQLDDESRQESRKTFFERTGWRPADLAGKTVLDVGCGMGRYIDVAESCGARVVGVDLSRAVDSAARNLTGRDVAVAQADAFFLPFKWQTFDLIYSLGVLHHTPSTHEAFKRLVSIAEAGRQSRDLGLFERAEAASRAVVLEPIPPLHDANGQRAPLTVVREGGEAGVVLPHPIWPLPVPRATGVPTSGPGVCAILDTFDWYSPVYQHKHRWAEVEKWFREAGFTDIRRNGAPIAVSGTRAVSPPAERPAGTGAKP